MNQPTTIGALRDSAYRPKTVKEELRANLITALASKKPIFEGIVRYEATVIPRSRTRSSQGRTSSFSASGDRRRPGSRGG